MNTTPGNYLKLAAYKITTKIWFINFATLIIQMIGQITLCSTDRTSAALVEFNSQQNNIGFCENNM